MTLPHPLGVTVVIPAYNYGRYLSQAIDSVLAQTYPHVECVVVDDGSTDDTPDVAAVYGDRIVYVRKVNAGLSAARNTGIERASCPFIAFLDADDFLHPEMLERMMPEYEADDGSLGLVACGMATVTESGEPLPGKSLPEAKMVEVTATDLLLKNRFCPASALIRRSVFTDCGGFDTELTSTEDRDMWIRIAARYQVRMVKGHYVNLRLHGNSMSKNAPRMHQNMIRVLDKHRRAATVADAGFWVWCRVYAYNYFHISWMYYDSGMPGQALSCLFRSMLVYPFFVYPRRLNDPVLFRIRAARTFASLALRKMFSGKQEANGAK